MLGSMKYSLYRRNVWIFVPESNLKKLHSSGQDGQLGEGSEWGDPQGNLVAIRALLNGTVTEKQQQWQQSICFVSDTGKML